MKKLIVLSALMVILTTACNSEETTHRPANTQLVTLEISSDELLRDLAGRKVDSAFNVALERARRSPNLKMNGWVKEFTQAVKEQGGDSLRLAHYFGAWEPPVLAKSLFFSQPRVRLPGSDPTQHSSDEEVITWLEEAIKRAFEETFSDIRNRLDRLGLSPLNISIDREKGQFTLELQDDEDTGPILEALFSSAKLEFRKALNYAECWPLLVAINDYSRGQKDMGPVEEEDLKDIVDTVAYREANPFLGLFDLAHPLNQQSATVGYVAGEDTAQVNHWIAKAEKANLLEGKQFAWMMDAEEEMGGLIGLVCTLVEDKDVLDGRYVEDARMDFDYSSRPMVNLRMNESGSKLWYEMTLAQKSRPVAILLNGQVITAPVVQEAIRDGRTQITGNYTVEEAMDLAAQIQAGGMPLPLRVVGEE